jgi:hypothetical protein
MFFVFVSHTAAKEVRVIVSSNTISGYKHPSFLWQMEKSLLALANFFRHSPWKKISKGINLNLKIFSTLVLYLRVRPEENCRYSTWLSSAFINSNLGKIKITDFVIPPLVVTKRPNNQECLSMENLSPLV